MCYIAGLSNGTKSQTPLRRRQLGMIEVWLRNNRRALALGMVSPALIALVGLLLATGLWGRWQNTPVQVLGTLLLLFGVAAIALLAFQMRMPRLAHQSGYLLVYLQTGRPFRVPLELVECFLLGQGPSYLPGRQHRRSETSTLVVRLDERAEEWSHRDVKPALGSWCGSHITIRGTWCEPLSVDLVRQLNARLGDANRHLQANQVSP